MLSTLRDFIDFSSWLIHQGKGLLKKYAKKFCYLDMRINNTYEDKIFYGVKLSNDYRAD